MKLSVGKLEVLRGLKRGERVAYAPVWGRRGNYFFWADRPGMTRINRATLESLVRDGLVRIEKPHSYRDRELVLTPAGVEAAK